MKRHIDSIATYAITALAVLLSYSKLLELAERAGYGAVMAHVWPLIVDGLALMAARGVLRLAAGRWYAWSLLVAGTAVSILAAFMNAMVPPGPLSPGATAAVTIVPALCVPFASHLARKMRTATDQDGAGVAEAEGAPEAVAPAAGTARRVAPTSIAMVGDQGASHDVAPATRCDTDPAARDTGRDEPLYIIATDGAPSQRSGKYTDEEKALALQLVADGLSQREAGRRIGAPGNTVRRWLAQAQAAA